MKQVLLNLLAAIYSYIVFGLIAKALCILSVLGITNLIHLDNFDLIAFPIFVTIPAVLSFYLTKPIVFLTKNNAWGKYVHVAVLVFLFIIISYNAVVGYEPLKSIEQGRGWAITFYVGAWVDTLICYIASVFCLYEK
jgi:hypothetical protein